MDVRKLIAGMGVSQEEQPTAKKKRSPPRDDQVAGDRVTLSARRMTPEEAATESAEAAARAEKLRRLKEAVRSGAYNPDVREVARNLLFSDFKPLA